MHARLATLAALAMAAVAVPVLSLGGAPSATASNEGQVCIALSSGKIDTKGSPQSVVVTAPAGKVIVSYCVKAGSVNQGDGPVYVTLAEPVTSLVIRHPSGKAVSHYSVAYASVTPTPTPTAPTPTVPTPTVPTPTVPTPTVPTPTVPTPTVPTPTVPTPTVPTPTVPTPTEPTPTVPTPTVPTPTEPTPTEPTGPFDWNWEYAAPTCDALTVAYPKDLPSGQANDVNIRLDTDQGQITLNYHLETGTWSGTTGFTYSQHRNWPVGVTAYSVRWVQVGGSNFHWEGDLSCRISSDGNSETLDAPLAVTEISGWRTSSVTVAKGSAATADSVVVEQPGLEDLELQRLTRGVWQPIKAVATSDFGAARVTFPRQPHRGTFKYRLAVAGTESVTGAVSAGFTVRVR